MTVEIPNTDFYYVGLHKTGSTFLRSRIFPLFDDHGQSGQVDNCYRWNVNGSNQRPAVLFAVPTLSGWPDRVEPDDALRISEVNPDAKIVISIRSQSTMLRSIYWLCVKTGDSRSFSNFVADVIANGKIEYHSTVERYRETFGPSNVLVMLFEEVTRRPDDAIRRLALFFGTAAPEFCAEASRPVKATPGDLEIYARQRVNAWSGNSTAPAVVHAPWLWLINAAYLGDTAYRKIAGRRLKLIDARLNETMLQDIYGPSNRRLFASLYCSPFACEYPGVGGGKPTGQVKAGANQGIAG